MRIAAGQPMPRVYVIESDSANAFATGRDPAHASVAVTRGLMKTLNREELQGVIGHEMSHVRNLDIRYMMLVTAMVGAVVLLADGMRHGARFGSFSRRGSRFGSAGGIVAVLSSAAHHSRSALCDAAANGDLAQTRISGRCIFGGTHPQSAGARRRSR